MIFPSKLYSIFFYILLTSFSLAGELQEIKAGGSVAATGSSCAIVNNRCTHDILLPLKTKAETDSVLSLKNHDCISITPAVGLYCDSRSPCPCELRCSERSACI